MPGPVIACVNTPPRPPSANALAGEDATAPKETTYIDPSGAIFSMYITRALKFDDENVENWKGGADGILVFVRFHSPQPRRLSYSYPHALQTGLFSSTVATFIAISYPNLQQDPNVTTQSILTQISQQLSNPNNNGTIHPAS